MPKRNSRRSHINIGPCTQTFKKGFSPFFWCSTFPSQYLALFLSNLFKSWRGSRKGKEPFISPLHFYGYRLRSSKPQFLVSSDLFSLPCTHQKLVTLSHLPHVLLRVLGSYSCHFQSRMETKSPRQAYSSFLFFSPLPFLSDDAYLTILKIYVLFLAEDREKREGTENLEIKVWLG